MNTCQIIQGGALDTLRSLDAQSVHTCVTSPPYWGLRDYGVEGQLGLEPTPEAYVEALLPIFQEVNRVLRNDGTLWLNLGDCYATGAGKVGDHPGGGEQGKRWKGNRGTHTAAHAGKQAAHLEAMGPLTQPNRMPIPGLKPKDLVGIPWLVAFALRADGWYLRRDIVWCKDTCTPESVKDRPTTAHEYLFQFSKSRRYYYDYEAVKEPATSTDHHRNVIPNRRNVPGLKKQRTGLNKHQGNGWRNRRSWWVVSPVPFRGTHFGTFPPKLIEPCILAGCPEGGTVLDPFAGAGTTGLVALKHGRKAILIELNPEYCQMAKTRIEQDAPLLNTVNLVNPVKKETSQ